MFIKKFERGIYLLIFLSLLPFFLASFYTHPSADDFGYAVRGLKLGWLEAQKHYYQNWSGRYTATSLLSGSPVYFRNLVLYKLMPVIWMSLLTAAFSPLPR